MYVYKGMLCMYMWRPEDTSDAMLSFSLEIMLLTGLQTQGSSRLCVSDARIIKAYHHTGSFHMDPGGQTQVL